MLQFFIIPASSGCNVIVVEYADTCVVLRCVPCAACHALRALRSDAMRCVLCWWSHCTRRGKHNSITTLGVNEWFKSSSLLLCFVRAATEVSSLLPSLSITHDTPYPVSIIHLHQLHINSPASIITSQQQATLCPVAYRNQTPFLFVYMSSLDHHFPSLLSSPLTITSFLLMPCTGGIDTSGK